MGAEPQGRRPHRKAGPVVGFHRDAAEGALAQRRLPYQRLDQAVIELLLGVRG